MLETSLKRVKNSKLNRDDRLQQNVYNQKQPDVMLYDCPELYLNHMLDYKQRLNPRFSLRCWSKKMGFKSHTLLNFLINKKRKILPSHLPYLFRGLDLQNRDRDYFETLVRLRSSKSLWEQELYRKKLIEISPNQNHLFLSVEKSKIISDWVHLAILEMTELKDFQSSPEWIAKRLDNKVNFRTVQSSIERLLAVGLLKEINGRLIKTNKALTLGGERSSEAIREHHRQMIQLGLESIEAQAMNERILSAFTMTIDSSRLKKASKLISEFRAKMESLLETSGGDSTYQCNIQFFNLTKKEKGI